MMSKIIVFGSFVLTRIVSLLTALVLSYINDIALMITPKSSKCCLIHINCEQHAAAAKFLASAFERVTELYLLVPHEISEDQKK